MKSQDILIYYRRRIFTAEEAQFAGTFAVDFTVKPYEGTDDSLPPRTTYYTNIEFEKIGSMDTKPMLVTLHGLSGGSHEIYLRHVLRPIIDAGWEACVINSRGCAKSKITTGVLYNARATWDVRQIVEWLRKTFPNRPLFGIGYSLGANILVNVRTVDRIQLMSLVLMDIILRSTWVRKARAVCSKLLLYAQTHGILRLGISRSNGRGLVPKSIQRRWEPA